MLFQLSERFSKHSVEVREHRCSVNSVNSASHCMHTSSTVHHHRTAPGPVAFHYFEYTCTFYAFNAVVVQYYIIHWCSDVAGPNVKPRYHGVRILTVNKEWRKMRKSDRGTSQPRSSTGAVPNTTTVRHIQWSLQFYIVYNYYGPTTHNPYKCRRQNDVMSTHLHWFYAQKFRFLMVSAEKKRTNIPIHKH